MKKIIQVNKVTKITLNLQSNRLMTIEPTGDKYEIYDKIGTLVGLDYGDLQIQTKQTLKLDKRTTFKINQITKQITKSGSTKYVLKSHARITKASIYMLPFIGYDKQFFMWNTNFTNAFLGTEQDGDYGNSIYVLCKYEGTMEFSKFENTLQELPTYITHIDPDKHQVLYQFSIPKEFKADFKLILAGKYSEISIIAKQRIFDFHMVGKDTPIGQVLYKSEKRRVMMSKDFLFEIPKGQELLSAPIPEQEIFLNKHKINDESKKSTDSII